MIFGKAPRPVSTRRGLLIGGGTVYPELNFTVPAATVINRATLAEIVKMYREIVSGALERALHLESNGLVLEFETLLEMTNDPFIGTEITRAMNDICEEYFQKHGLRSEIRLTPNDSRDMERPPLMRSGRYLDAMMELFDKGAEAGGDLLSIESTGGKEICDEALMNCDIKMVLFSLSVLGVRDMQFLWSRIAKIAKERGKIAGGDTACGFANTAMVLADKGYIPKIFASAVRIISVVRSLVAVEEGAVGPDKDCGYEGVYLKAIAGIPVSMEGRTAACAHLSPVGNIASACADLWSNESVQHLKLLGGMAPTVFEEILEYDARLLNAASDDGAGTAAKLRDLLVKSDVHRDPQAYILSPKFVIEVASEMLKHDKHYKAALKGTLKGMDICRKAIESGELKSSERENEWLDRIVEDLSSAPDDEGSFIAEMLPLVDSEKCRLDQYGL
jgi:methanol--5-hydroxybenzimidazolylcobamide Co-methyltransferase